MADQKSFNDHIEKLMFIKRLQARENLFDKFLTGDGVLPSGGGLAHGMGLGSGGGLDNSGFKNRKPAIQTEMLTTTPNENEEEAEHDITQIKKLNHIEHANQYGVNIKSAPDEKGINQQITLEGSTKELWNELHIKDIKEEADEIIAKMNMKNNDPKNFHGTTSKAVIFEKDGSVLKYKSIAELCKAVGLSKYQILKGFKPKKNGDSFFHEKLGAKLTFVNRSDL